MTNAEATTNESAAAVAQQGATVAPEKAPSKKGASQKKAVPKGQKTAKGKPPAATPKKAPKPKKASSKPTAAKGAPAKAKATKDATAKDGATGAKGPRDGSKTAQVVAMLQRKNGATLAEIMDQMGWQKHTVRGFMAGAMKKAGYTVESFKPEGGERTYRINS